jgi:ABC-type multidrug transport system ATPase subunit
MAQASPAWLRIVFGDLQSDFHSLRLNGHALIRGKYPKGLMAYLPQNDLIPSYISIKQALKLFDVDIRSFVDQFPDADRFIDFKPHELSGGYRRIFEVLLILKSRAKFCFLDEPFSGLMPLHVEKIIEIMMQEKNNKGVIVTDHLYKHVAAISDSLYVLANGQTYPVKEHAQLVKYGYLID